MALDVTDGLSVARAAEAVRGDVQAMREYHRRALHLAQSRGDVFNILAARLTYVECAAVLGVTDGIVELATTNARLFRELAAEQPQTEWVSQYSPV